MILYFWNAKFMIFAWELGAGPIDNTILHPHIAPHIVSVVCKFAGSQICGYHEHREQPKVDSWQTLWSALLVNGAPCTSYLLDTLACACWHSLAWITTNLKYVLVIAWAEDIMAISSPRPRAQPEDKDYLYPRQHAITNLFPTQH